MKRNPKDHAIRWTTAGEPYFSTVEAVICLRWSNALPFTSLIFVGGKHFLFFQNRGKNRKGPIIVENDVSLAARRRG